MRRGGEDNRHAQYQLEGSAAGEEGDLGGQLGVVDRYVPAGLSEIR
jgi:hypothetical protein